MFPHMDLSVPSPDGLRCLPRWTQMFPQMDPDVPPEMAIDTNPEVLPDEPKGSPPQIFPKMDPGVPQPMDPCVPS